MKKGKEDKKEGREGHHPSYFSLSPFISSTLVYALYPSFPYPFAPLSPSHSLYRLHPYFLLLANNSATHPPHTATPTPPHPPPPSPPPPCGMRTFRSTCTDFMLSQQQIEPASGSCSSCSAVGRLVIAFFKTQHRTLPMPKIGRRNMHIAILIRIGFAICTRARKYSTSTRWKSHRQRTTLQVGEQRNVT